MDDEGYTRWEGNITLYEYLHVKVPPGYELMYSDCYEIFGWHQAEPRYNGIYPGLAGTGITLRFRRDRKTKNRDRLAILQKKCEDAIKEIIRLERSKAARAFTVPMLTGLLGGLFFTGAVFGFLAEIIPLFIVLAVAGFFCCASAYLIHGHAQTTKKVCIAPKIDEQYDLMYQFCGQARELRL